MMVLSLLLSAASTVSAVNFIPASDPSIWYVGRTRINADQSRSFDWEATQIFINLNGSTYAQAALVATGDFRARFVAQVNGWEETSFWVDAMAPPNNTYQIAAALIPQAVQTIRLINVLEPSFTGANPTSFVTFMGFYTDGAAAPPTPRTRTIELLGDSISAGYGSRGYAGAPGGCPVTPYTSGNYYDYSWFLAEAFQANLVAIAWSGKGIWQNCCDNGERMPAYYLQTLGGESYSTDYNFDQYTPDMMLINLGTNDFGHDSGPAWEAEFVATYVEFVKNATTRYNNAKLPIFVAQGPMNCDVKLNTSLQNAITGINSNGGNAVYLNMCGPPNDGCGGHPGVKGHAGMFEMAQPVIAAVMGW